MKISAIVSLSLLSASIVASQLLGSMPMDATPVLVKVYCDGIELETASMSMGAFAGSILEETFAKVHPPSTLDDTNLTGLVFHGHGMTMDGFDEQEYLHDKVDRRHKTPAVYSGLWNCRYCPDDPNGVAKKAWEATFASSLVGSEKEFFHTVKSCNIDIGFAPQPPNPQDNAAVTIKCKGFNLKNPTVAQATYAAHALEASYNKVHGHHDDGDDDDGMAMEHVTFHAQATMGLYDQRTSRRLGVDGMWYPVWLARMRASIMRPPVRRDDDNVRFFWLTDIDQQTWETQFATFLRESEFKVFQKVKSCAITVNPTMELLPQAQTKVKDGHQALPTLTVEVA